MTDAILAVNRICKRFDVLQVSKDVSLDVQRGEIHALIGPNGAGKSTLIQQIAGALQPDDGQILLEGYDVTKLDVAARARMGLSRTFQISELAMEDTVFENVLLGAIGKQRKAHRLLGTAAADHSLKEVAEKALSRVGLATYANNSTAALSHGQRRQLEIAIALTLDPSVFVMDEPMAGLGTQGTHELIQLLDKLKQEAPILMVEHDMDAVFMLADRISVLVYGEIIATGTVDEIRQNPIVQQAYLGEQH